MKPSSSEVSEGTVDFAARRVRSGPAEVRVALPHGRVHVVFDGDPGVLTAQLATPGYDEPREGDRVLAMTDDFGSVWVVGVISAPRSASLLDQALEGFASEASLDPATAEVRDREGRLLFEYDARTDKAVLHVPSGDLEISVAEGALRMRARDGIELDTDDSVRLRGGRAVQLEASRADGPATRISMDPGQLSLVGSVLTAAADRAEILVSKLGVKADQVESHVDRVRNVVKVLDTRAGRIIQRAKDVYQETEGLHQTRAGRLRMAAAKAVQIVGENTLLKARDRMKVKGERIHLA
jgi:hypothetical protein